MVCFSPTNIRCILPPDGAKIISECKCPAGSSGTSDGCQPCAADTYKVAPGFGACTACASGKSTLGKVGTNYSLGCSAVGCPEGSTVACPAGKFHGLAPCSSAECGDCIPG